MQLLLITPCYNESENIEALIDSVVQQVDVPDSWMLVDDLSTDDTYEKAKRLVAPHSWIKVVRHTSKTEGVSSEKIVRAVQFGLTHVNLEEFDIICKSDGDLRFPPDYFQRIRELFKSNEEIGIAGGVITVEIDGKQVIDSYTNLDHVRGALKAYRKACFLQIGGLNACVGWDSIDEYTALYHGWKLYVDPMLKVEQIRHTASNVGIIFATKEAGRSIYRTRIGFLLALLGAIKKGLRKPYVVLTFVYLYGYFRAAIRRESFIVSKEVGAFTRKKMWNDIRSKYIRR